MYGNLHCNLTKNKNDLTLKNHNKFNFYYYLKHANIICQLNKTQFNSESRWLAASKKTLVLLQNKRENKVTKNWLFN